MSSEAPAVAANPPSIDDLLAHYLGLLDEYTRLRAALSTRQASLYSSLARANFAAERGMRYGPDQFDERMQALVRLEVTPGSAAGGGTNGTDSVPSFAVSRVGKAAKGDKKEVVDKEVVDKEVVDKEVVDKEVVDKEVVDKEVVDKEVVDKEVADKEVADKEVADKEVVDKEGETSKGEDDKAAEAKMSPSRPKTNDDDQTTPKPRDPLKWFGVLTPMALRQAQQDAIEAVDQLIPRLASLDAEMAAVEIEVRRARKKRARAAAAREKEEQRKQEPASKVAEDAIAV